MSLTPVDFTVDPNAGAIGISPGMALRALSQIVMAGSPGQAVMFRYGVGRELSVLLPLWVYRKRPGFRRLIGIMVPRCLL